MFWLSVSGCDGGGRWLVMVDGDGGGAKVYSNQN